MRCHHLSVRMLIHSLGWEVSRVYSDIIFGINRALTLR